MIGDTILLKLTWQVANCDSAGSDDQSEVGVVQISSTSEVVAKRWPVDDWNQRIEKIEVIGQYLFQG